MFSVHLPHLEQFIQREEKVFVSVTSMTTLGKYWRQSANPTSSPLKMIPFLWITVVKMPESPRYFSLSVTFFLQKEFFQPAACFCFPLCKSVPCDQRYVIIFKTWNLSVSQRVRCCNLGTVAVFFGPHPEWPGHVSDQCVFTAGYSWDNMELGGAEKSGLLSTSIMW